MTEPASPAVTATAELAVGGRRLSVRMSVPTGPTRPRDMLPLFRSLAETLVEAGVAQAAAEGRSVSCTKGCGACCRQLVPIAPMEAKRIADVIDTLPPHRRREVRARFDAARLRLREVGLLAELEQREQFATGAARDIGMRYFALGIACPFLEHEACSIYDERPIACREYLVTSPAENCAAPSRATVACVAPPAYVSRALRWLEPQSHAQWVPLILAPHWAAEHDDAPARPGTELVRELFRRLSGTDIGEGPR